MTSEFSAQLDQFNPICSSCFEQWSKKSRSQFEKTVLRENFRFGFVQPITTTIDSLPSMQQL